jgi:hypothetical protein
MEYDSDYEDINYLNQTISDDELSDVENCDGAMAMSPIKKMREENEDKENKIPTPIPKDKTAGKIKTIFLDIYFSSFLADTHHEATYLMSPLICYTATHLEPHPILNYRFFLHLFFIYITLFYSIAFHILYNVTQI